MRWLLLLALLFSGCQYLPKQDAGNSTSNEAPVSGDVVVVDDDPVIVDSPKDCNPWAEEFKQGRCPDSWSKNQQRNYQAGLAKPGEYYGLVKCAGQTEATNFRYELRSHFEWDLNVFTGFSSPGQVNISVEDGGYVTWGVIQ